MTQLNFKKSQPLSLGVELELQLIDLSDFDLAVASSDMLVQFSMRTFRELAV
jgi:carboxylate-amine ligase